VNASRLLAEFAKVLNEFGPDSPQGEAFIQQHGSNKEFVELARLSAALKRALMPDPDLRPGKPRAKVRTKG